MGFLQLKTLKKQKIIFLVEVKLGRSQSTVSKLKAFRSWGFTGSLEAWFPISLKWASWVPASPRGRAHPRVRCQQCYGEQCFETCLRDHWSASIRQQGGQAKDQAALGEDQIMSTPLLQVQETCQGWRCMEKGRGCIKTLALPGALVGSEPLRLENQACGVGATQAGRPAVPHARATSRLSPIETLPLCSKWARRAAAGVRSKK